MTFEDLVERMTPEPDVELGRGFSRPVLKRDGKIFAIDYGDALVVKLPADRCAELVETTAAVPFDRGQGKPLREWVVLDAGADWLALAGEALSFARTR
jgi:hypothetical protein